MSSFVLYFVSLIVLSGDSNFLFFILSSRCVTVHGVSDRNRDTGKLREVGDINRKIEEKRESWNSKWDLQGLWCSFLFAFWHQVLKLEHFVIV